MMSVKRVVGIALGAVVTVAILWNPITWALAAWGERGSEVGAQKIMLSLPCRPETKLVLDHSWTRFETTPGCRRYLEKSWEVDVELKYNNQVVPTWNHNGNAPVFYEDVEVLEARLAPHESVGVIWVKERDR